MKTLKTLLCVIPLVGMIVVLVLMKDETTTKNALFNVFFSSFLATPVIYSVSFFNRFLEGDIWAKIIVFILLLSVALPIFFGICKCKFELQNLQAVVIVASSFGASSIFWIKMLMKSNADGE